jgi:hypothetical protein
MTTKTIQTAACVICGEMCRNTVLMSTNTFGSPDLDLRPPPMQRDTMDTWVQCCRSCGFVAADIAENAYTVDAAALRSLLERPAYKAIVVGKDTYCLGNFERQALLEQWAGTPAAETKAWHNAAWSADDAALEAAGEDLSPAPFLAMADRFRREVIRLMWATLATTAADDPTRLHTQTMLVDLLRRSGAFEQAEQVCDELRATGDEAVLGPDAVIGHILTFQRAKARVRDTACYTIANAVPVPPDA